jgi:hypothetical protein
MYRCSSMRILRTCIDERGNYPFHGGTVRTGLLPHGNLVMAVTPLHAYIDESGQRCISPASSDHFVLAAAAVQESMLPQASALLADIRHVTGRQPGQRLSWRRLTPAQKRAAAALMADCGALTISSVVICKREFHPLKRVSDEDTAYMFTFRLLLERLSWLAKKRGRELRYTLSHVIRFKKAKLGEYEAKLRTMPPTECKIAWSYVDPLGGRVNAPQSLEYLQLADLVASGIAEAFEPNQTTGTTTLDYIRAFAPLFFRGTGTPNLTSNGLKMLPWDQAVEAKYPWISSL